MVFVLLLQLHRSKVRRIYVVNALLIALSVFVFFVKIGESFCSAKNVVFFIDVVNKESCVMLMEIRDFFVLQTVVKCVKC